MPVKVAEQVAIPSAAKVVSADSIDMLALVHEPRALETTTATGVAAAIATCKASKSPVFSSYKNSKDMVLLRSV